MDRLPPLFVIIFGSIGGKSQLFEILAYHGRFSAVGVEVLRITIFSKYGDIVNFRLVRDIVTGISKQYAFIEYSKHRYALRAKIEANHMALDGRDLLVDWECERTLSKWIPRRLGGGFGGRKESGQLRFGGTDRPHRKPIIVGQQHHSRGEKQDRGDDRWRERNPDRYRDDRPTGYRAMSRHDRRQDDDSYYDRHRGGYDERSTHRNRDQDRQKGGSKNDNEQSSSRHSDRGKDGSNSTIKTEVGCNFHQPRLVKKRNTQHLEIKQEKD